MPRTGLQDVIEGVYYELETSGLHEPYHTQHGTDSALILTVYSQERAQKFAALIADRIRDKVVVEIGAGVGLMAVEMAKYARTVWAIEADPAWTWVFAKNLYKIKPPNLTWIFGAAKEMLGVLKADVAVVVTHSDLQNLRDMGQSMATEVIMFHQDYEEAFDEYGKLRVP